MVTVTNEIDYWRIWVHMKDQWEAIEHTAVKNTYVNGPFFCVYCHDGTMYKYPIENIRRITEMTEKQAQLKAAGLEKEFGK